MSGIDAGTIYSSIRLKIDQLNSDINGAISKMDNLAERMAKTAKRTENLSKFGKNMSTYVTAPLIVAAGAMIKFASDTGEAMNAANVVFGKSAKIITDWGETAATQAGLSAAEFYQSAAVIGAGLQNAGIAADEAALSTIELTKRAADMASIFNTDVKDSMIALQSAIRGESEPIRRYAVTLTETAVRAKAMALGLVEAGQELSTYAKTQARLAIIMEQTNRFQGDFVRTSDDLANSTRITVAMFKNEAAELGKELLPVALEVVKAVRRLMEGFGDLTAEQKTSIIAIGALAAGVGPLVLGISKTIDAIDKMKIALTALSANPITFALLGVAALYLGLQKLGEANNQRMLEEVADQFGNVGELAGVAGQKINDIQEVLARSSRGSASFEEMRTQTQMIADDMGVTVDQVYAIGLNSEKVTKETKDQLRVLKDINDAERIRLSYIPGTYEFQQRIVKSVKEEVVVEKEKAKVVDEQADARKEAQEKYLKSVEMINEKTNAGIYNEAEARDELAKAANAQIEALLEAGYSFSDSASMGGLELTKMLYILDALEAKNAEVASGFKIAWRDITENGLKKAAESFDLIGQALAEGTLGWKTFAKAGLLAIATVIEGIAAQMAAYAARDIALHGFFNPIGWASSAGTLAKAAGVYTLAGVVKGYAGKFEDGGVIGGRSYTGDKMLISANSNEVVNTAEDFSTVKEILQQFRDGMAGSSQPINIILDKKVLASVMAREFRSNKV